jgi:predicted transcriptional regulator
MIKSNFISLLFLVILFSSCSEDGSESVIEFPEVITTPVLDVTVNNVIVGGVVISDGGGIITKKGIVWSTSEKLTLNDSTLYDQSSEAEYKLAVKGLKPNTTYYFTAFA